MDSIPSVLSSAQSLITGGFSMLNRAAAQFAALTSEPTTPTLNAPTLDPLLGGLVDMLSARADVSAGVALLDASTRLNEQLIHVGEPYDPTTGYAVRHPFDQLA
jgi:hypothetical protein